MKAIRIHRYGGPEVLVYEDAPEPALGAADLRIRIRAAGVNPVDYKMRGGSHRGLLKLPTPWIPGMDVSGTVIEAGEDVTGFAVGDEIFASPHHKRQGCYAEEVVVRAEECAHRPASISHEEAASIPLAGLTAWASLVDACNLQPGQNVLIQAGAGGVGSLAIQIAKHLGAKVYTTCSVRNLEFVKGLGADVAIDYREKRFEKVAAGCDAALEAMGDDYLRRTIDTLRPGATVAAITGRLPELVQESGPLLGVARFGAEFGRQAFRARLHKEIRVKLITRPADGVRLAKLAALVDQGALRPVVEQVLPLARAADAHRHLQTGHARGKTVLVP